MFRWFGNSPLFHSLTSWLQLCIELAPFALYLQPKAARKSYSEMQQGMNLQVKIPQPKSTCLKFREEINFSVVLHIRSRLYGKYPNLNKGWFTRCRTTVECACHGAFNSRKRWFGWSRWRRWRQGGWRGRGWWGSSRCRGRSHLLGIRWLIWLLHHNILCRGLGLR